MTQEQLRMQMLAGIITESQYAAKLNEIEGDPEDYYGYQEPVDPNDYAEDGMEKVTLTRKIKNLGDFGLTGDKIEFKGLLITASTQEDEGGPYYFVYGEDDDSEDGIFSSTNPEEVAEFVLNY